MLLTTSNSTSSSSSSASQAKSSSSSSSSSSLARKIKIRQIADSGRSSANHRVASSKIMASEVTTSSSSSRQRQQQQQEQPKVRKIAVESGGGSGSGTSGGGGGGGSGAKQQRPRNSRDGSNGVLQSSSASAAARSVTRRAASPVLSQSGRRQLVPSRSPSPAPTPTNSSPRPISKSASLPANLRADPADSPQPIRSESPPPPPPSYYSILKRSSSSSLLASLLQLRRQRRKTEPESCDRQQQQQQQQRKCVSFSADTVERQQAEEERQRPVNRQHKALHEAKLYRKGVLQDRRGSGCNVVQWRKPAATAAAAAAGAASHSANLPLSWEESLGGPRALLGAAHDADDELVQKIVNLANKVGLGNIQLNAQDNSGRTAISYLAGNGSALVLEACLALPGADANLADNEGNTPLHFAAQAGQTECLNILLQRCPNIEVDARNNLGFTPLMKAGLQGRTKCAKILLFAGANPTLRDHGRGLRAEQWARFCGRYVCAEVIERFARHRLLEKTTSCRWGSEPELAAQVLQGKLMPVPSLPVQPPPARGLKSKIRRVFRTTSNSDKTSFSLVSQLTSAALCASSPVLPKPGDVSPVVKSLLRPLSVPQLRITLVAPQDVIVEKTSDKCSHSTTFSEKIESTMVKPPRTKKKSK